METLLLYSRPECHLCDVAAAMLADVAPQAPFRKVDIERDINLLSRYSVSIPVLQRADGAELGWPFDAAALTEFLEL